MMVTKEEEQEARSVCSWCNFCRDCEECTHREFPSMKYINDPRWDYRKCECWREYLLHPIRKLYNRILCKLRLHDWLVYTRLFKERKDYEIRRKCTKCKLGQKHIEGKWVNVDVEDDVN